ncbi:AAA family ATPase [Bradyrhizobium sp. CW4]|uniref:AAA family ATPase n=1 Tax=Bradyrhizobium sp. CW4 TaxID=2782687 RepID=UPI001FFC0207|nr:AAA family ATPase [Bradyrhizobium sp. CW4]MCK1417642.1 AAA family ATPase [Bradyrhizobium sp. CW4]
MIKPPPNVNGQPKSFTSVCAEDVIMRSKDWLWEGHLMRGTQELLSGIPGLGKSQVQCSFVACVTTKLPWPNGEDSGPPANVVMMTAEDTLDQEVVPRLKAAGADLSRVHFLKSIRSDGKDQQFLLGEDLDMLEKAVMQIGEVALVTIDPITAYMGKIDSHKTTDVRSQLGPLKDFAERMNIAISTITHPPKSSSHNAIDHFIGSQAFIAAGRIGHLCSPEMEGDEDRVETGRVLFAHAKHNPSVRMPTLVFRKEGFELHGGSNSPWNIIKTVRVVWEGAVDITADEAVRASNGKGGSDTTWARQKKVQAFLRDLLEDGKPVPQKIIQAEAEKRGFTYKQLDTAKRKIGVVSTQTPEGWTWQLIAF